MQNELAFINEDVNFILQELLAVIFNFFRHCSTEHEHLLRSGCLDEDVLDISPHASRAQHLIAFVDHEELALS